MGEEVDCRLLGIFPNLNLFLCGVYSSHSEEILK